MEPRTHARGNEKRFDPPEAKAQLQWSHALTRVETNARTGPIFQSGVLQWSHALTRVETANVTFERMRFELASMEPRTHARGNPTIRVRFRGCASCFNGATHSRAWKPYNPCGSTAPPRCFNGATHSRAWKPGGGCRQGCRRDSFNGATHSRAWKRRSARRTLAKFVWLQWSHALTRVETQLGIEYDVNKELASMEPRTHARGNKAARTDARKKLGASMEPRTHARGNLLPESVHVERPACFNGATHSRAWKRLRLKSTLPECSELQWSHALTRVETRKRS